MTTAHLNAPADVAGTTPDVGGASNEPAARAPMSTTLPTKALSDTAGELLTIGTVVAAVAIGAVLRGWLW